jgi:DNA-directed RNA polymerase sigma subunit (sigma70/sigma32)
MREPIPFVGFIEIDDEPTPLMTQEDIALVMGVSRQTVRNIEESAFKKIRRELFKRGYNKDDLL